MTGTLPGLAIHPTRFIRHASFCWSRDWNVAWARYSDFWGGHVVFQTGFNFFFYPTPLFYFFRHPFFNFFFDTFFFSDTPFFLEGVSVEGCRLKGVWGGEE